MTIPPTTFFVHSSSVVEEGSVIGKGTRIWHFSHIREGCRIGEDCILGQNVYVETGVILGNRVKVQNNVSIYTGVICEDDVFIGPSVVFTNVINPRSEVERKHEFRQTKVNKGATIGANATVICGHTIGAYAMIGAGTVVTKDVKPYALVTGNPGRLAGWVSKRGHRLEFDIAGKSVCPESGSLYRLQDGYVEELDVH